MAKIITVELNISERLSALSILNQFKGNLDTLAVILEDIRKFTITEEDWTLAERKVVKGTDAEGKETTSWNWENEKGGLKSIEIDELTANHIVKDIKERDDKGEFTLSDKPYISLREKLA